MHAPDLIVWDTTSQGRCPEPPELSPPQLKSRLGVERRRLDARMLKRNCCRVDAAPFHIVVAERALAAHLHCIQADVDDVLFVDDADWIEELRSSVSTLLAASARLKQIVDLGRLVGPSVAMQKLRKDLAFACAASDVSVLLAGETGTGKRVVAEVLHAVDPLRSAHPFHAVDCGAVVPGLLGSELFGHVRGAFTGANVSRAGAFQTAGRGTLLLDELGELDMALQPALLAALQQRTFRAVGSDAEQGLGCRVISASNRDLESRVDQASFREDLLHRVAQITVRLPALRERRDDLPALCRSILGRWCPQSAPEISPDVAQCFAEWTFKGNVRELESILRHALLRAGSARHIRIGHLPESLRRRESRSQTQVGESVTASASLDARLSRFRRETVDQALREAVSRLGDVDRSAQIADAARALQISTRSLYNYLSE